MTLFCLVWVDVMYVYKVHLFIIKHIFEKARSPVYSFCQNEHEMMIYESAVHIIINVFSFLLVADQFCLEDLKSMAFMSLCMSLNVDNVVDIYVEAATKLPMIGKMFCHIQYCKYKLSMIGKMFL